jgi:hypothetical protein
MSLKAGRRVSVVVVAIAAMLSGAACGTSVAKDPSSKVCDDVASQSNVLMNSRLGGLDASNADISQLQAYLTQLKNALIGWAKIMRNEADKAEDSGLAAELRTAAGEIDGVNAELRSLNDLNGPALADLGRVGQGVTFYCPQWKKDLQ